MSDENIPGAKLSAVAGFKKLVVWQKSMRLLILTYKLTSRFPREEMYGITSQMRRAAVSVPSNIAEGSRRRTEKDRRRFFEIALGSASELETQLDATRLLGYAKTENFDMITALCEEVSRMLNKLANGN